MTREELIEAVRERMYDIQDMGTTIDDCARAAVAVLVEHGAVLVDPVEPLLLRGEFAPEDFQFTADLLRKHMNGDRDLFQAVASNNLNIILSALDQAAEAE
jgi:hypothetical protein